MLVVGATAHSGATTVALALATGAAGRARLVEAGPMHTTGLASATTAELGVRDDWRRGSRDDGALIVERTTQAHQRPGDVPVPAPSDLGVTIVDSAWDLPTLTLSSGWISDLASTAPVVIATTCTVPGLRALDTSLTTLNRSSSIFAAVIGPPLKKWPRRVSAAATAAIQQLQAIDRLFTIPRVRELSITGLTSAPLPSVVTAACHPLLDRLVHPKGSSHACD